MGVFLVGAYRGRRTERSFGDDVVYRPRVRCGARFRVRTQRWKVAFNHDGRTQFGGYFTDEVATARAHHAAILPLAGKCLRDRVAPSSDSPEKRPSLTLAGRDTSLACSGSLWDNATCPGRNRERTHRASEPHPPHQ